MAQYEVFQLEPESKISCLCDGQCGLHRGDCQAMAEVFMRNMYFPPMVAGKDVIGFPFCRACMRELTESVKVIQ